jgi:transcriptional regulator of NAD metabolism
VILVDTRERRETLLALLHEANNPLTGAELAGQFGVSRQVIVQDIAILRAGGADIFATPQGYLIVPCAAVNEVQAVVACRHTFAQIEEEIGIVVDRGGRVLDVIVEHPVYGELRGSLMIANRRELKLFIEKLEHGKASPLLTLTGGIHLHTLQAPGEEVMAEIITALDQAGILMK